MPTPGINDPNWFEWYVGLKHIIEMINPDSNIKCVIFQHESYNTIDDVVVEYGDGNKQICYQVKHEIATSKPNNLTFGKLLEKESDNQSDNQNSKCLFEALFLGWNKAIELTKHIIKPVLFTNRSILNRRAGRTYNGEKYSAYPVDKFLSLLKDIFKSVTDSYSFSIKDPDLLCQWKELCDAIGCNDVAKVILFLKDFEIQANQPSLAEMEQSLISSLTATFSCSESLARELLSKLVFALSVWTTTRRIDERVTIEDVYSVLGTEEDINESQHRLAPPFPYFESRQTFCNDLAKKIKATDKKVVFISGDPGSGKTSTISYLQSTTNLFLLRYHTFRPISPEQHFYNDDAGMYSSANLWGTFLIQLRQKLKGKLSQYSVPINNMLLTTDMMRSHVCRLLGILAGDAITQNKRVYVCIDGIDHAARANSAISFLSSLPLPNEIPDGVCFVIVGQPSSLYQTQYPVWLLSDNIVEHIDMPKLCINDIKQLILSKVPQFCSEAEGLASIVYNYTKGNNLSTVFAIEEIRELHSLDQAIAKLSTSGISPDVQQYYSHLWNYVKAEIVNIGLGISFPESIIACPILLMNGRVNTRILSRALPYKISENDWKMILTKLHPLVVPCSDNGDFSLFNNDFRVFLMGIISSYHARYEEIALALAEDLLHNNEGLLTYVSAIPLLQCANKSNLIPKYFTPQFIVNALAEGISKQRLDNYAHSSYEAAYVNRDYDGYLNTYLAVKTLYQHKRYFECYERKYVSNDYPEINTIDISEIHTLPINTDNLEEYKKVLTLCAKLRATGTTECLSRYLALYNKWFGVLTPYSFVPLFDDDISEKKDWEINTNQVGIFLQQWGKTAAELRMPVPIIEETSSKRELRAVILFGDAYFGYCIDNGEFELAVSAISNGYVSQYCFAEKLENIYYSGLADGFIEFLPNMSVDDEKPFRKLLAMTMQVTYQRDALLNKVEFEPSRPIKRIYDEVSFAVILRSFLIGCSELYLDDNVICSHVNVCYSSLDEKEPELNQIAQLCKFACLLGKYYWKSDAIASKPFIRFIKWFLTTKQCRSHDYSKARKFLLFTLLKSQACELMAINEYFTDDLKTYLFETDNLCAYYKTCILDYFKRHNRNDIIREYILTLYGNNCSNISLKEDKVDIHKHFLSYGEIVEPQMMIEFSAKIKWDVVGYMGSDEYAMQGLSDCFETISKSEPSFWRESGYRLYRQSKIAKISNNNYYVDIRNNITKAAANCGFDDFWELHSLNKEFGINPDSIYHSLIEFIQMAECSTDFEVLWLLNCGIHSWYTQEDRIGSKCIYDSLYKKAREIGIDFKTLVATITPQWLTIIDHESKNQDYQPERDKYTQQKAEQIAIIKTEYDASTIDDLIADLPGIALLSYSVDRYSIILDRLISQNLLTPDNANCLLKSVCAYLREKEWFNEGLDSIIITLLNALGEESFWTFAYAIGEHLSDYNYQTSTRNMQFLLKLYLKNNIGQMKLLFEQELATQELWVTGNNHITVCFESSTNKTRFDTPRSLYEMALYILLEQIETQNSRKLEAAIFALYLLGKQFPDKMNIIALNWPVFSDLQKDYFLLIATRWIYDNINLGRLNDLFFKEYTSCISLSRKYYLHSILLLLHMSGIEKNKVCCDTYPAKYVLPVDGVPDVSSFYENFLSLVEKQEDFHEIDNIRRYISKYSATDKYAEDEYSEAGDFRFLVLNPDVDKILYGEEMSGHWDSIPLLRKKSRLIPKEDPFILTEMPQIVYDEEWFPSISYHNYSDHPKSGLNEVELSSIARKHLCDKETLLAACIWYPWQHEDGVIYYEVAKAGPIVNLFNDKQFDLCLGNFGLLANEGAIDETHITTLFNGGINLFNRMMGNTRIYFGNNQLTPSAAWRELLKCEPSTLSPYIWNNENGEEVLRFERIASPIREAMHEFYIRQPILFRWICNSDWLYKTLNRLRMRLWYIRSLEEMQK